MPSMRTSSRVSTRDTRPGAVDIRPLAMRLPVGAAGSAKPTTALSRLNELICWNKNWTSSNAPSTRRTLSPCGGPVGSVRGRRLPSYRRIACVGVEFPSTVCKGARTRSARAPSSTTEYGPAGRPSIAGQVDGPPTSPWRETSHGRRQPTPATGVRNRSKRSRLHPPRLRCARLGEERPRSRCAAPGLDVGRVGRSVETHRSRPHPQTRPTSNRTCRGRLPRCSETHRTYPRLLPGSPHQSRMLNRLVSGQYRGAVPAPGPCGAFAERGHPTAKESAR